ncbi:MAG: hypothetical protein PVH62_05800, partial [Anaerolineae bacterium]
MHIQPGRWFGFLTAVTMALQVILPVPAVPPAASADPTLALLPAWFLNGEDEVDRAAVLLPDWYAGAIQTTTRSGTTLTIAKSATPDPVDQGALLTYIIAVTNETTNEAQRVMVLDTTPAGTVFESARVLNSGGTSWFLGGLSPGESGDFIWYSGDWVGAGGGLPRNSTAVLELVVRAVGPFPDGLIHNDHYYVDAENAPTALGVGVTTAVNDSDSALAVSPPTSSATSPSPAGAAEIQASAQSTTTLDVVKSDSPDPVDQGENLTYVVTVTNQTAVTASHAVVTDTTPAGTVYVDADPIDGGGTTWFCGGPPPGCYTSDWFPGGEGLPGSATATLKFTFQATGPFPDQALIHNTQYCADADNAERACGA